ncbi:unnamed protein product [Dovyalis caffra]|uniref:Transmembrane protein n=1 Tax=Dovyalis caffra TaxID=77055 RepID=A0AAV1QPY6_9ROSI|nr:unnamed protein product [Dovyalis caffra]
MSWETEQRRGGVVDLDLWKRADLGWKVLCLSWVSRLIGVGRVWFRVGVHLVWSGCRLGLVFNDGLIE